MGNPKANDDAFARKIDVSVPNGGGTSDVTKSPSTALRQTVRNEALGNNSDDIRAPCTDANNHGSLKAASSSDHVAPSPTTHGQGPSHAKESRASEAKSSSMMKADEGVDRAGSVTTSRGVKRRLDTEEDEEEKAKCLRLEAENSVLEAEISRLRTIVENIELRIELARLRRKSS